MPRAPNTNIPQYDPTASVLMEIEKAGVRYTPNLKKQARAQLRQFHTDGAISRTGRTLPSQSSTRQPNDLNACGDPSWYMEGAAPSCGGGGGTFGWPSQLLLIQLCAPSRPLRSITTTRPPERRASRGSVGTSRTSILRR